MVVQRKRIMGIGPAVLRHFEQHVGVTLYLADIAKDLGYPEAKVQATINSLRNRNVNGANDQIEIMVHGNAWRWGTHPAKVKNQTPTKRLFEELAITKTGDILIQDDQGNVFLAKAL